MNMKPGRCEFFAYGSAVVAAVWWFLHVRYPGVLPVPVRGISPIPGFLAATAAGGYFVARQVMAAGIARREREAAQWAASQAETIRELKKTVSDARAERDLFSERERFLRNKLTYYEEKGYEDELSALRKRLRMQEEGDRTVLHFLVRDLFDHLAAIDCAGQEELDRAVRVLKKELEVIEGELKLEKRSFFETVLKVVEIRENIFDLTMIGGALHKDTEEAALPRFPWAGADSSDAMEHEYRFLKVAFHPDRFPSESMKEKAVRYFQQVSSSYHSMKEKAGA